MGLAGLREVYRKADVRLRLLLFGDGAHIIGRLKGDVPRQQAAQDLARMRNAFAEAVEQAEKSDIPADLKGRAVEAKQSQRDAASEPQQ